MSPMQVWSNESQERYVLAIEPARLADFERICERERCLFAVVGEARGDGELVVTDPLFKNKPVDMPLEVLLGKPPRMHRDVTRASRSGAPVSRFGASSLKDAAYRVLRLPSVADKTFLVTIGDRSVGGMCARDQMVGPWQVPVADCAVTTLGYSTYRGEAMAIGERTPLALIDGPASGAWRWARRSPTSPRRRSPRSATSSSPANWMCAAGHPGEDATLFDTVKAVGMELCPALGISIPVGKDSMSMRTTWRDAKSERGQGGHRADVARRLGLRAGRSTCAARSRRSCVPTRATPSSC